jgi:hypothetical protein
VLKNSLRGSAPQKHRVRMPYKRFYRVGYTFLVTRCSSKRSFSTATEIITHYLKLGQPAGRPFDWTPLVLAKHLVSQLLRQRLSFFRQHHRLRFAGLSKTIPRWRQSSFFPKSGNRYEHHTDKCRLPVARWELCRAITARRMINTINRAKAASSKRKRELGVIAARRLKNALVIAKI